VAGVLYLAEFYFPGGEAALADLARRVHAAALASPTVPSSPAVTSPTVTSPTVTSRVAPDIAGGAGCAGFVLAIHVPADEICFALYDAQGADAVLSAGARAGITFERVTAAILLAGPGQSVRWLA
jgi:hypothetical protein